MEEYAKDWRSFKDKDRRFFKDILAQLHHCPSALYSISKLLNDVGSIYLSDGVIWISDMLRSDHYKDNKTLNSNTIYYLENIARKYAYENQSDIARNQSIREALMIVLDILIANGSVTGYIIRDNIM